MYDFDLILRLAAYEQGRAQPRTETMQIAIQPHAHILCALVMAGEESTIWMVLWGAIGQPPEVFSIPDPRQRDDQYDLFAALATRVIAYGRWCRAIGTFPQVWVSSPAGATNLDQVSERCRSGNASPTIEQFGALLAHLTARYPIAGQQTLCSATSALSAHWATGQQPSEDDHLGAMRAWIAPSADRPTLDAVMEAERVPMGIKTDPVFDRETLQPLLIAYHGARRRGDTAGAARGGTAIADALMPEVRRIYDATQHAIALLRTINRPPLPDLEHLVGRECAEFAHFMDGRDKGYRVPLRDTNKQAVFGLAGREQAAEDVLAAACWGDRVARAARRMSGHVLMGQVANPEKVRIGPRKFVHRFTLVTDQPAPHVRPRDELWSTDGRMQVCVDNVHITGDRREIALRMAYRMRSVGLPGEGLRLELVPDKPDWGRLGRQRGQLKVRLATMSWTHVAGSVPPCSTIDGQPATEPISRRPVTQEDRQ